MLGVVCWPFGVVSQKRDKAEYGLWAAAYFVLYCTIKVYG